MDRGDLAGDKIVEEVAQQENCCKKTNELQHMSKSPAWVIVE